MIPPREALGRIIEAVRPLGSEEVPLAACVGRVLAKDLSASIENPPFDNSSMDGYAVKARDTAEASRLRPVLLGLSGEIPAGHPSASSLPSGKAARILTGAPMPRGADAVVMQEQTDLSDGRVKVFSSVDPKENVRSAGEDVRKGDPLLPAGRTLNPLEVALLASQGVVRVPVARRPRTAIVATGSELVRPAEAPAFGQLRDSNGPCLAAAVRQAGAEPVDHGIVRDRPDLLTDAFAKALDGADLLLVSGGVSVGDYDHTRKVLEELGMKTLFWRVAVKPGKPLLFGMRGSTAVFGLPGNPVSVWVSFEEFVRPAIGKMLGRPAEDRWRFRGKAVNEFRLPPDRQQYLFCRASQEGDDVELRIIRPQGSGMLGMASKANALAMSPPGARQVGIGEILPFRWIG
ncbi:MAG: gephyrin-like molybdotransferase Glp [Elusimicrobiota bacterium]